MQETNEFTIQDIPCPIIGEVCDHPDDCNCAVCERLEKHPDADVRT